MKEQLNKQIGPFKLWQWLIVAAAGITLGLVLKNRFAAKSDFSGVATPSNSDAGELGPTQGASQQISFDFNTLLRFITERDRLQDELENRDDEGEDGFGIGFDPSGDFLTPLEETDPDILRERFGPDGSASEDFRIGASF